MSACHALAGRPTSLFLDSQRNLLTDLTPRLPREGVRMIGTHGQMDMERPARDGERGRVTETDGTHHERQPQASTAESQWHRHKQRKMGTQEYPRTQRHRAETSSQSPQLGRNGLWNKIRKGRSGLRPGHRDKEDHRSLRDGIPRASEGWRQGT